MADLLDREYFRECVRGLIEDHRTRARAFGIEDEIDGDDIAARYAEAAERMRPMICDTVRAAQSGHARRQTSAF